MTIYYTTLSWDKYEVYLAATASGLSYIGTGTEGEAELRAWQGKNFPECALQHDDTKMNEYKKEINDYLLGKRKKWTSAISLYGTDFQKEVWHELQKVPYGEVRTYAEIAAHIGRPKAVRAVANAIGKNPLLFIVPCHRIIRKDGTLSGFRAGIDVKKKLLKLEQMN